MDFNRTLVTWDPGSMHHHLALATRLNLPLKNVEAVLRSLHQDFETGRLTANDRMARLLSEQGLQPDLELMLDLIQLEREECLRPIRVYPAVYWLLTRLRRREISTAILSNGNPNTVFITRQTGLASLVDATLVSCEIGIRKPNPLAYQAAVKALGLEPAECTLVDDGGDGSLAGARAAGLTTVAVLHSDGYAGQHPDDLACASDRTVDTIASLDDLFPALP